MAVCGFDQDLCGWTNDYNNWKYRWVRVTRTSLTSIREESLPFLCLPAKSMVEKKVKKQSSSWLPIQVQENIQTTPAVLTEDIQARLWSESVPVGLKLRCLAFSYRIRLGPSVGSTNIPKFGTLAMLQRQAGC